MIKTDISHYKYNMYYARIKRVYKYSEARLMLQSLSPLDLVGLRARQGGSSIQTYHTTNIICTKQQSNLYSEARLRLQSLPPLNVLGIGGMQGGTFIQTYHATNIICTKHALLG